MRIAKVDAGGVFAEKGFTVGTVITQINQVSLKNRDNNGAPLDTRLKDEWKKDKWNVAYEQVAVNCVKSVPGGGGGGKKFFVSILI